VIAALLPRLVLWLWFFAALLGGPALLLRLPPSGLPVTIGLLAIAFLRFSYQFQDLRDWVARLPLRTLLMLHVCRIAGVGLLILHLRGAVDGDFAMPIGLGEIAVGCMALPVALAPLGTTQRLRAATIWNIAGFTELLLAVALATRLASNDPDFFRAVSLPPTVTIPLFAVPLLAASHVVIFLRTRTTATGESADEERSG
jgi:hypothetical protein